MTQMTHSKPIKNSGKLTQAWLEGFEKYRENTALFSHPSEQKPEVKKTESAPKLPGFELILSGKEQKKISHATFPMLPYKGKTR